MDAAMQRKKTQLASALGIWAGDTVADIQQELLAVGANDQGLLMAATISDPVRQEGRKLKVTVHNDLEYASVIEFGRRPRSGVPPPLLPLVGWAKRKGILSILPVNISFGGEWAKAWAASGAIFRAIKNRKGAKKSGGKPLDPVVRELLTVRAIANKIFEKGTVGRHPFSKVIDRRGRTFSQDIASLVSLSK